jgi:hypothetical protein
MAYRMITNVNRGVANDCMVIVGWIFCTHCFGYHQGFKKRPVTAKTDVTKRFCQPPFPFYMVFTV